MCDEYLSDACAKFVDASFEMLSTLVCPTGADVSGIISGTRLSNTQITIG
jgi:hypothetical protein